MFSVALIGPDGCGKTTVAKQLEQSLPWPATYVYMGVSLESSNLMLPTSRAKLWVKRLLGRPADNVGPRDRTRVEKPTKSPIKRLLRTVKRTARLANQVLEEGYRQHTVKRNLRRQRVVLSDRDFYADYYNYDIASDVPRSWHRRLHGWMLSHWYRQPDLVLYLDVPAETMFARKGEGTVELLERRRADYLSLARVMPQFEVVDARGTLEEVVAEVKRRIIAHSQRHGDKFLQSVRGTAETPPAIIVGIDCVTGLQSVRNLAARGVPVVGIAKNKAHYCAQTRLCQQIIECDTGSEKLIDELVRIGPGFPHPPVLFPCTDLSVLTISQHRDRLAPWYRFALPEHQLVDMYTDKVAFAEFARERKIPYPVMRVIRSVAEVESLALELRFPCYVKPPVKTADWEEHVRSKVIVVKSVDDLRRVAELGLRWVRELLVQEEIVGPPSNHFTCNAYYDRHHQVAGIYTSQKLRQWPLKTGTGCLSVECECAELQAICQQVFDGVGFHGPAYVDVKRDARTGELLVVETNVGRPTGRSSAAAQSGVDFLHAMYCDLLHQPVPPTRQLAAQGRKWIHLRRDLQAAAVQIRNGELSVVQWWHSLKGPKSDAVFAWRDPAPAFAEIRTMFGRSVQAMWRRLGRHRA